MITNLRNHLKCNLDTLYLLYFLPIVGCVSMGISSDQVLYKGSFAIAVIFLLIKVWATDYLIIEIFLMGIAMTFLGYVYIKTSEKALILSALSIFGCKDVCIRKILKYIFWVYIIGMTLTISMVMLGIVKGEIHTLYKSGIEYKINDYGFSHPNSAYSHLLIIALMMVAIWQERLRWYHYVVMTVIMFAAYKVFLSRTGFFVYLLLCMAITLLNNIKRNNLKKLLFFVLNFIPMAMLTISCILIICYDKGNSFADKLNNFVTGRIMLSSQAYKYAGVNWFGPPNRDWMRWFFVDNAYLSILITYGILTCILFVAVYTLRCFRCWRAGEYYILIILSIIAVYAFMEYIVVNATWNPLLLFMSGTLIGNHKSNAE